ncbi:uncharacterized protein LOC115713164 [Cannabis sativa]|uniref:uncharacterized protein LOC115713164 n=1 Tax=Cannabis sativa TaxID=3483 RepID=UPI0029C9F40F|nr:uncharacterized protein LOC115713164 [Cannabis sativa]
MNKKEKQEKVTEVCRSKKIGIGAFIETKVKAEKLQDMMASRFSYWDYYSSKKMEGRILLLWRKKFVNVEVIDDSKQYVHCHIKMIGQKKDYFATFVYGANTIEGRSDLWSALSMINTRGKEISALELEDSKNLIANSSVGPMNRTGSNFTWTNKQDNRIFSRIDHVFHNEDWVDNFPNTPAHFSWDTCSDHCFCVVHSTATENIGTKPFCCYKFWAEHLDYKKTVLDSWGKSLRCCGLKGIHLKTMRLKQKLKRFNRNVIGSIGEAFEKAKESYIEAQFQCQANPNNIYFLGLEHEAENQFHTQEKMYQSFLHQRSNVNWIQKGDSNTTYFHALLKKRKEENRIVSFVTEQGDLNDHFPYVVQHFISHFQGIMGKVKPTSMEIQPDCIALGPKLNLDQQVHLLKRFSLKEVRAAMFSILITKSPGPDGFGSGFFWSVWPEVGKDRNAAIALFFDTNQFPTELHNTTPSLIPKTESPSKAIDYRPFACWTTLYKCVSKLICSRLANVLPNLVSRNQGRLLKAVPLRIIFLFFRIS